MHHLSYGQIYQVDQYIDSESKGAVVPEFAENKPGDHNCFADIASGPAQEHLPELSKSDGAGGVNHCISLVMNIKAVSENQIGHGPVLTNIGWLSAKLLVQPFEENIQNNFTPICGQCTGSAHDRIDHTLACTQKIETEGKGNLKHPGDNTLFVVQDAYVSCNCPHSIISDKWAHKIADGLWFHDGVTVNGYVDIPLTLLEAQIQGMPLAPVNRLLEQLNPSVPFFFSLMEPVPGIIAAAVINSDNIHFFRRVVTLSNAFNGIENLTSFIIGRNDYRTGRQFLVGAGSGWFVFQTEHNTPDKNQKMNGKKYLGKD